MMLGRILLALAGVVLLGTAGLHASGGGMVAGWLSGERGTMLQVLWHVPALDWAVVAIAFLLCAWRGNRRLAPLIWLLALVPAGAAAMIAMTVGASFLGVWLLAGAALFAVLGSIALPRA